MPEPIPLLNGVSWGDPVESIEVVHGDHTIVILHETKYHGLMFNPAAARLLAEQLLRAARLSEEPT